MAKQQLHHLEKASEELGFDTDRYLALSHEEKKSVLDQIVFDDDLSSMKPLFDAEIEKQLSLFSRDLLQDHSGNIQLTDLVLGIDKTLEVDNAHLATIRELLLSSYLLDKGSLSVDVNSVWSDKDFHLFVRRKLFFVEDLEGELILEQRQVTDRSGNTHVLQRFKFEGGDTDRTDDDVIIALNIDGQVVGGEALHVTDSGKTVHRIRRVDPDGKDYYQYVEVYFDAETGRWSIQEYSKEEVIQKDLYERFPLIDGSLGGGQNSVTLQKADSREYVLERAGADTWKTNVTLTHTDGNTITAPLYFTADGHLIPGQGLVVDNQRYTLQEVVSIDGETGEEVYSFHWVATEDELINVAHEIDAHEQSLLVEDWKRIGQDEVSVESDSLITSGDLDDDVVYSESPQAEGAVTKIMPEYGLDKEIDDEMKERLLLSMPSDRFGHYDLRATVDEEGYQIGFELLISETGSNLFFDLEGKLLDGQYAVLPEIDHDGHSHLVYYQVQSDGPANNTLVTMGLDHEAELFADLDVGSIPLAYKSHLLRFASLDEKNKLLQKLGYDYNVSFDKTDTIKKEKLTLQRTALGLGDDLTLTVGEDDLRYGRLVSLSMEGDRPPVIVWIGADGNVLAPLPLEVDGARYWLDYSPKFHALSATFLSDK